MARPIFLLTDFGTRDSYVGQMRAVIASISPESAVHDLTHEVSPFAIDEGAWLLASCLGVLPQDAVVVAVVDPGVGSTRRAIVVERDRQAFVGPDNGLLSPVFRDAGGIRELQMPPRPVSATFHGRDLFAPAGARIAAGLPYDAAPGAVTDAVALPLAGAEPDDDGSIAGQIIHIDRYGNGITTIRADQLREHSLLVVGGNRIRRRARTFSDVGDDLPFLLADSSGYLAIAVNLGSAEAALGFQRGDLVQLAPR